jgi:hypothetical protein
MKNCLVIVRVGDKSLHPSWLSGNPDFDIYLSYFGDVDGRYREDSTYYEQKKGGKWPVIADLIEREWSLISGYKAVWMPDDDLLADTDVINDMFCLFRSMKLRLAQPALTLDSYYSWGSLLQNKSTILRYVNFIEVMAPIFSQEALGLLRHTFIESKSGWGLDFMWCKMVQNDRYNAIAVLDATPVRHTRPVGGELYIKNPDMNPSNDWDALSQKHPDLVVDAQNIGKATYVYGGVVSVLWGGGFISRKVGRFIRKLSERKCTLGGV